MCRGFKVLYVVATPNLTPNPPRSHTARVSLDHQAPCDFSVVVFFPQKLANLRKSAYLCSGYKKHIDMSKQEKEEKVKEFWEYYEATQDTITITDPVVLD